MKMNRLFTYFQNLRFKQKLISSYLVVSIIPLMMLGAFSYMQANNLLLSQAKQNLDNSISQVTESVNYRAKQHEAIINSITQNIVFKQIFLTSRGDFPGLYRDYVDPFFGNILDFNPDILQISVFTDRTELLRGEYILPIGLTKDLEWSRTGGGNETQWMGNNGKFFATRSFTDNETTASQSETHALLFLSIDGDSLFKGLDDLQTGSYGVFILNREGQPFYSKNVNMEAGLKAYEDLPAQLEAANGFFRHDGTDYVYVNSSLAETGWKVFYFTPKSGLSVDVRSIVNATALIMVACFLILLFIISMFSNTFVKRITNLNKTMMMVENGNLKVSVASPSTDEIGQLTNRFNRMLGNINTLIEEVYQSKIVQKEAELKALQTQINPHFLYNTLSIINWKALEIDAMEISRITTTVSKFYRTVLNKGKNTISVANELENAKAYMHIQLIMHNNSFDFHCDVEEELLRFDMINLIFQPILENALEHGIDQLRKGSRRGRIELTGRMADGILEFVIRDNGPGMEREVMEQLLDVNPKGYGLKNVHDRIQILFGSAYGLRIWSKPDEGTAVTAVFPQYTEPRLPPE
jgi:two-component system, sensor histidine kinase YesM